MAIEAFSAAPPTTATRGPRGSGMPQQQLAGVSGVLGRCCVVSAGAQQQTDSTGYLTSSSSIRGGAGSAQQLVAAYKVPAAHGDTLC
jgi:hypothetical protein